MSQEKYSDACSKFEASQSLEAGLGTLLNLADCYEKVGRTASAWAEFLRAAALARRSDQPDREEIARERARLLEPLLTRLAIQVPREAAVSGLVVKRGEVEVEQAAWGSPIPVDPGKYVVTASAPGRLPQEFKVELAAPGETVQLQLTLLEEAPVAAPKLEPEPAPPAPPPAPLTVAPAVQLDTAASSQQTWGWVLGGVGAAALAGGGVLGLLAKGQFDDAGCENGLCPSPAAQKDSEAALDLANYGTISAAIGGALLVTGAAVYLLAPSASDARAEAASTSLAVVPMVSGERRGLWLTGGF
jgi:hypothetical protein